MLARLFILALFFMPQAAKAAEPVKLTSDQTQIIRLQQDAEAVIVNNPTIANVTLDNKRLLIITPHNPGTTSIMALDNRAQVIFERDVIVSNVKPKYVRIRRQCASTDPSCAAASYSYCPDGCYELTTVPPVSGSGANTPPPPADAADAAAAEEPRGLINGEPAETLIDGNQQCPAGYSKQYVPGASGDAQYTCTR